MGNGKMKQGSNSGVKTGKSLEVLGLPLTRTVAEGRMAPVRALVRGGGPKLKTVMHVRREQQRLYARARALWMQDGCDLTTDQVRTLAGLLVDIRETLLKGSEAEMRIRLMALSEQLDQWERNGGAPPIDVTPAMDEN